MTTLADRTRAAVLGHAVLPFADALLGQRMMARLRVLNASQGWSREELTATRDVLLQEVVRTAAAEVAMYRELYRSAHVDPDAVRSASDLAAFPIVTKSDLRAGYPERTSRPTGQRTHDACTSGSTGAPLCVQEDPETAGWHRASFLQILAGAGWALGAPHVQFGASPDRGATRGLKDFLLRCRYVSLNVLRDPVLDVVIDEMAERKIRYVFGYPAGIEELARRASDRGLALSLVSVVTWGDSLRPVGRATIESAFGCVVYDAYGIGEGLWIASQCRAGRYHVRALDVVLELVDDAGRAVAPGDTGHVVVTRLHAGATPLIRYQTGDLAARATEPCHCGRGDDTIARVVGRSADTMVTPSGNRLMLEFFTRSFDRCTDVDAFQAAKTHADRLELRIVAPTAQPPPSAIAAAAHIAAAIPDMRVELQMVDALPLTRGGKLRFVIDETAPFG